MDEQEVTMWSQWKVSGCENAKHFLYEKYQHWASLEAVSWHNKLCRVNADKNDFFQYAMVGLLEAISNFDVAKGVLFKSYAQYRIKGAILNNIFKFSDDCAHKSTLYSTHNAHDLAEIDELIDSSGLVGAIEELAIEYLLENELVPSDCNEDAVGGYYYSSHEMALLKKNSVAALAQLGEPKGTILSLHYGCEKSLTEISKILELSLGRVSQLKKQGLVELSQILSVK